MATRHLSALAILAITWLVMFWRIISGQAVYFLDDLKIIYYPLEHAYAQAQAVGELPLWSPVFGFGHPLLAWGQLGFFTPVHLLLRDFQIHPLDLLQISVITYFALGLLGIYATLRQHKFSALAASLGAMVYVLSGFNIGHLNHVNFYTGTMVLPWLLLCLHYVIKKPTPAAILGTIITASAIVLSAQPQIVLYCFALASLYAIANLIPSIIDIRNRDTRRRLLKVTFSVVLAGIIAFLLSTYAILPLAEFLPLTERNDALAEAELFEFSYPPYHTITLLFPYFFGDHDTYWGPKGFQELAAYVGIIPLVLALGALTKKAAPHQNLRYLGLFLLVVSAVMATGVYSPVYRYLVQEKILTSLANPGRFVFFFTSGIAFLAAIGLDDLLQIKQQSRARRFRFLLPGSLALTFIIAAIAYQSTRDPRIATQALDIFTSLNTNLFLLIIGVVVLFALLFVRQNQRYVAYYRPGLVIISAITLLTFGWHYNPLMTRTQALASPPFESQLASDTDIPARLYARDTILASNTKLNRSPTPHIAPAFSVYQPVTFDPQTSCLTIPAHAESPDDQIFISWLTELTSPAITSVAISGRDIISTESFTTCFPEQAINGETYYIAITSSHATNVNVYLTTAAEPSAYVVRVAQPSVEQFTASQKPLHLVYKTEKEQLLDSDVALLSRHLNATVNTSSARWIGALAIRPYREFIEFFFANDRDDYIDGDGVHVLNRYRNILDMVGVTHLTQLLDDPANDQMLSANYNLVTTFNNHGEFVRLYNNPQAYPKAFLVPEAQFIPAADDTRAAMLSPTFNPSELVYITGPVPPQETDLNRKNIEGHSVNITEYHATTVTVEVTTPEPAWLVLTDASVPQWQTFINNQPAPYYIANTIFKAAHVPAGTHTVSFTYASPAVALATQLTRVGLVLISLLGLVTLINYVRHRHHRYSSDTSREALPSQTS